MHMYEDGYSVVHALKFEVVIWLQILNSAIYNELMPLRTTFLKKWLAQTSLIAKIFIMSCFVHHVFDNAMYL